MVSHRIPELHKVKSRRYSEFCNLKTAQLAMSTHPVDVAYTLPASDIQVGSLIVAISPIDYWLSAYHMRKRGKNGIAE
jgi:hypothetical protein